ncbi:hypothetical protein HZH66_007792 [Vespula vulgaris]|uniref:Uncharacterized protein n=1 Tax=Vespula vulgaris TaxID=7454 RepID=A0A834JTP0_VESVU|nr:hypothetical protein HZH66_007792 [Vespula vulgaris]
MKGNDERNEEEEKEKEKEKEENDDVDDEDGDAGSEKKEEKPAKKDRRVKVSVLLPWGRSRKWSSQRSSVALIFQSVKQNKESHGDDGVVDGGVVTVVILVWWCY